MKKTTIYITILLSGLVLNGCISTNDADKSNSGPTDQSIRNTEISKHVDQLRQNIAALYDTEMPQQERQKVVELQENGSVYYFAADGKRYIFPNSETYKSWFGEYVPERSMPLSEMQEIPLGGNVTARPGTLLQTPSDPKVYLIQPDGIIRPVDEDVLNEVYSEDYTQHVNQIQNYYFTNYTYGDPISDSEWYPLTNIQITIDKDKGFDE